MQKGSRAETEGSVPDRQAGGQANGSQVGCFIISRGLG